MRENMAKIRVGGEINWWKSCSFCLLRFSKHKSISTAVLFCIIVGGGYSRKVFRLRSFFISSRKAWKKMEFAVGFSSVNIVGFHRDVLLFLKLYTLVEEPSLDQISQALQATVFWMNPGSRICLAEGRGYLWLPRRLCSPWDAMLCGGFSY